MHNYVKKCLVYGIQAFDTIPNSTQLVISALQKHVSGSEPASTSKLTDFLPQIVVECKVADKLLDCWNENSRSQLNGGRRMGYMGHLVDILGAVQSTISASEEFRALIESSVTAPPLGEGEPQVSALEAWQTMLTSNDEELKTQSRLLADCDPSERQDYGISLAGFPSTTNDYENDTEDFDYQFNASMQ